MGDICAAKKEHTAVDIGLPRSAIDIWEFCAAKKKIFVQPQKSY
jgi:hypothetical protein